MTRRRLAVANWKMYIDSPDAAKALARATAAATRKLRKTGVVLCPSAPFLALLSPRSSRASVLLGAQDVFWGTDPKQTGQISPYALREVGVSYCIVGHSEMRSLGETDERVSSKAKALLKVGLSPIVCVGEDARDHRGDYLSFLETQIRASFKDVPRARASSLVIAYEPLWAIGRSAEYAVTPAALHETVLFIKKILVSMYGRSIGTSVRILYGGSVEPGNVVALIRGGAVDGVLVGHASADLPSWKALLSALDKA